MNAPTQFPEFERRKTPMKIAIATDAWFPQVNGVVRTLSATITELHRRG